jgi:hypothetical protein
MPPVNAWAIEQRGRHHPSTRGQSTTCRMGNRATPRPTPPVDTRAINAGSSSATARPNAIAARRARGGGEGPPTPRQREEGSRGVARKAVVAAQGRQSWRREEGSRSGARKAVAAARGRQSRQRGEGSRGGARKAVAAARGRQSRRREEGSGGGVDAREIDAVLKNIQKWLTSWQWRRGSGRGNGCG